MAAGNASFQTNCSACHGRGGQGFTGYPNLNDDDWLWGGKLADIMATLQHGIRAEDPKTRVSEMPRFGADNLLTRAQVEDVAEYVLSFTGRSTNAAAAERGKQPYTDNCVPCHGDKGQGNVEFGAPKLNDQIWLYGGDRNSVVHSITFARAGVMPAWSGRLDEVTLKQLALYVHSLGGGK